MRLVLLGATGQTGKECLRQALQDGHSVTAVVRSPEKITDTHDNLKVVKGDIFDEAALTPVMAEKDAVVSCLGFSRNPQPVTGYEESMKATVEAMRKANISRLVTMTAWYSDTSVAANCGFFVNWLLVPMLRPVLNGMRKMEEYLETSCQDINYTVVRPPGLKNSPLTGQEMSVSEGEYFVNTNTSRNSTSRADVAAFMLSCLKTNLYDRKMVAITTTKKV